MIVREIFFKTVRCAKNNHLQTVQDIVQKLSPEQITHEYSCPNFISGTKCANCQYH
ncbi:hypothetical protein SPACI_053280 [Sporomusa acidovorans DSM 3132]|uniref:Transposase zinc-binding domain-containing protein n=1 Tax=Sporomusa acidovorans (strain ATCC 49682 / DSM 3132 / Mol) TaxID=1123286 RepID=A0ABZ3JAU1_SPOA4|nr:hypothetical protein SPACI_17870 [Sporomusa acidovorans DSM 3132]SDD59312.1 hypothetical protein SAMN04488499_1002146 [Sporomusa acidovorans]